MSLQATAGTETRVNTYTLGDQYDPAVIVLADGGWLTTWTSSEQDDGYSVVNEQRYRADGKPWGHETRVTPHLAAYQGTPGMTLLADGGWVVTWNVSGDAVNVYQQRYSAAGKAVGSPAMVNAIATGDQYFSHVAGLADGGWVVTWQADDRDGSGSGIYQRHYGGNGKALGDDMLVNSYTTGAQTTSSIVTLADGGWVVSWTSSGQDGSSSGIYQQRYSASGAAKGGETQVNLYADSGQFSGAIAALGDGGWVVSWTSQGQDAAGYGIFQRRYAADGTAKGDEIQVNTYTTGDQNHSSIATLSDGGWVVAWDSDGEDGDGKGVFEQRYAADGTRVGTETQINVYTTGNQNYPVVTAFSNGGWMVTWEDNSRIGGFADVYQRHYANDVLGTASSETLNGTTWSEMLIGYGGNDRFVGKGGSDIMIGGYGNDIYTVDSKGDDVQELPGQGSDTIRASISFSLGGDLAVENLVLTSRAKLNGNGNSADNHLTGNVAANILKGGFGEDVLTGGKGNDILYGGGDADRFVFHKGDNRDAIRDFDTKGRDHDIVDLSHIKAIDSYSDLIHNHLEKHGSSVIITEGHGDTITLVGIKASQLSHADFHF
jgi:Ca2+-binding RTX toxin-like protein